MYYILQNKYIHMAENKKKGMIQVFCFFYYITIFFIFKKISYLIFFIFMNLEYKNKKNVK